MSQSGSTENQSGNSKRPISRTQVERNTYGGLTSRQVLGGEKDWLGTLGVYDGTYGSDERTPNYQAQVPQVIIEGSVEQQLNAKFGLTPTSIGSAQAQTPGAGENYIARFGQGLLGAVKSVTTEPILQVRDMAVAGMSVAYNEVIRSKRDQMWLPDMKSGIANAYASGVSQGKLLLQSNFVTGVGVLTYDATTALMDRRYGDFSEISGGAFGSLLLGKGTQKFGGYGVAFEDIGGPKYGPLASQRGAINPKLIVPDSAGIDIALKFKSEWTEAQRAGAIAKAQFLNDAPTVVTQSDRSGTAAAMSRYRKTVEAPASSDLDHMIDLQLGGSKAIENLNWLDSSVNRSLGVQIHHQIKNAQPGTLVNRVTIGD